MNQVKIIIVMCLFYSGYCNETTSKFLTTLGRTIIKSNMTIPELLNISAEYKISDLGNYYGNNIEHLNVKPILQILKILEETRDIFNPNAIALNEENAKHPPLVKIEDGIIRGKIVRSKTGLKYYLFTSIPYARKPKRWQAPEEAIPWKGILNATEDKAWCWQPFSPISGLFGGSEDCLFLSVYTKSLTKKNIPVIVHVHGGQYRFGNGGFVSNNPSLLIEQGVIVVLFNYRLGVFGFLSSGTKDAPGNAGLKDAVMALKWIQKNIHHFGGDPNNVTVYGYSSGAAMVELLLMSPLSQGLFNKVILQSGSAFSIWGWNKDPEVAVFKLAGLLNVYSPTIEGIMKKLKRVDPSSLIRAAERIGYNPLSLDLVFKPCAEKIIEGETPFLTEYPEELLKNGYFHKVPVMQSFVENEGNFYILDPNIDKSYYSSPEYIISRDILVRMKSVKERENLLKKVKEFYYKDYDSAAGFSMLSGDAAFIHPMHRSTLFRLNYTIAPIYSAVFAFDSEVGTTKLLYDNIPPGVSHADDLNYYIPQATYLFTNPKSESLIVIKKLVTMMANFVKYGNPTPKLNNLIKVEWKPIQSANTLDYLYINGSIQMKQKPFEDRMKFWDDIYKTYDLM